MRGKAFDTRRKGNAWSGEWFSSPAGTGGGAQIPKAAHSSQLCPLQLLLPRTYPRYECFGGGSSRVGIVPRIRPNLDEAREAELRVLGFDFALSLIDSSTSQEAQQRC